MELQVVALANALLYQVRTSRAWNHEKSPGSAALVTSIDEYPSV